MSPAEKLLAALDGVKRTGPGRYVAKCPAHDDRRPSLTIRELDDGRVLVKDWSGCSAQDICAAVGLTLADLFPQPEGQQAQKGERRPWMASDVLRCVAFEAMVASCAAAALAAGEPLSSVDRERLLIAAQRLQAAVRECGL